MTEIEREYETIRFKILEEINEKFDEVIRELNDNGTEYSRSLKAEVENMREGMRKEFENLWSFTKSKLVSIEQGQKLFYDDIFPKIMDKTEAAVKMARDAALCTVAARDAAKDAKSYIRANIFVTAITFLGILVTVVGGYFAFINKTHTDLGNQAAMIKALKEKIVQDAKNQAETMEILRRLHITLKNNSN